MSLPILLLMKHRLIDGDKSKANVEGLVQLNDIENYINNEEI